MIVASIRPNLRESDGTGLKQKRMATFSPDALDAAVVESASGGEPISREAACQLLRADAKLLPSLLTAAQRARAKFKPGVITYSRKVFLPLTNLCRDYCGYCTFRRDPGDPGAHTMTPGEVMEVVRAGERMGCTEALFSLGDKPEQLFPEMREDAAPLWIQINAALSGSDVRESSSRIESSAASESWADERGVA